MNMNLYIYIIPKLVTFPFFDEKMEKIKLKNKTTK